MKRFACLVNQSRRMREECEQNTLPARPPEPPIKLNQHLSPGNPRRFCLPPLEEIFAKVLKKQSCLRQNLLVAAVAKSFCGEESVE